MQKAKMKATIFFIHILFLIVAANSYKIKYDGYKMFKLSPQTEVHVEALFELQKQGVVFMSEPSKHIGREYTVMFAPHLLGDLLEGVLKTGMQIRESIADVQKAIDAEVVNTEPLQNGRLSWDRYNRLEDIYEFLRVQAERHPEFVSTRIIGSTYEGRNMTVIIISKPGGENKPAIWIDSNIHAREWITGAVCTYIINELLTSDDPEIVSWLDKYDWYILPIANPDGYEYTFTNDRFWRKTRSHTSSIVGCKGIDPNRNFDFHFLEGGGASNDPCSLAYAGPEIFSELETRAMAEFIREISSNLVFYLSLHSSGQYILIPNGFTNEPIPQYNTYKAISDRAAAAHFERYNTNFTAGNVVNLMYVATGISMDWVWDKISPNLSLTYELRDKGQYGHLLPAEFILPSALEFIDGFRVIMNALADGIPPVDPTEPEP